MNSTSDIVDELGDIKNSINFKPSSPKTIDDILQQNIQNIEDILDSKVINIYARPWSKLEQKLKVKKIDEYFSKQDSSLKNDEDKIYVKKNINNKKKVSIEYDIAECEITKLIIIS